MKSHFAEIVRYGINGVVATAVHYAVLTLNLNCLNFKSAGSANFIAALFGIFTSFVGSRYFVFATSNGGIIEQAAKFCGIYGSTAVLHGILLWFWTDLYGFDYRFGFLIATAMQMTLSYIGNKFVVFKR